MVADASNTLPEGVREGNEKLILLTEPAGAKLNALILREQKGNYLRVKITGGGCNGLSYKMKFVQQPKRGDILVRSAGVLIDSKSALYIKGTTLDYSDKMAGGGFKLSIRMPKRVVAAAKVLALDLMTERLRLLLMIVAACTAHTLTAREFTVVAYNVENLRMGWGCAL